MAQKIAHPLVNKPIADPTDPTDQSEKTDSQTGSTFAGYLLIDVKGRMYYSLFCYIL